MNASTRLREWNTATFYLRRMASRVHLTSLVYVIWSEETTHQTSLFWDPQWSSYGTTAPACRQQLFSTASLVSRPFTAFFFYCIHLWCAWFRGAASLSQINSLPFPENMTLHKTALYQTPVPSSWSFLHAKKNIRKLYITQGWICISNSQSLAL